MTSTPNSLEDILGCVCGSDGKVWGHVHDCPAQYLPAINKTIMEAQVATLDYLLDGKGRKTNIWHYELNDANEMEASAWGEYLSIKEVEAYQAELRQQIATKYGRADNEKP